MSADLPAAVLDRVDETRRAFLNRMLAATPFMVPAVASFTIASLTANEAVAQTVVSTKTGAPNAVPATSSVGLVAAAAGLLLSGLAVLQHHRGQQADDDKAE
jgi:hypothetical protein